MNIIDIFYGIWNKKYPEYAGRIGHSIEIERNEWQIIKTEITFEFVDESDEELYYKMSYLCKMVFGSNRTMASYTHDMNGWFKHNFIISLDSSLLLTPTY